MTCKINQNKLTLIGRLAGKPEIRNAGEQYEHVSLSVATNKGGYSHYNTIKVWNTDMQNIVKNLDKGSAIKMVGRINDKKYNDKAGNKKSSVEIYPYEINSAEAGYSDVNDLELFGRLVSKPELKETAKKLKFAKIAIAVANKKSKSDEGPADFFNITVWGNDAVAADNLEKGDWVELKASLKNSKYTNGNGDIVYTTEINASLFRKKIWEENNTTQYDATQSEPDYSYEDIDMNIADIAPVSMEDMPFC